MTSSARDSLVLKIVRLLHNLDYAQALPLMAKLPLCLGYMLSELRGVINGCIGRDWRSMALGTRHVARHTAEGLRLLKPLASEPELHALVRERFQTESREEFEGRLIAAGRVPELHWAIAPADFLSNCLQQREKGLLLLTPHFDSFMLGIAFLGLAGVKVNVMTSSLNDPRISAAVQEHFFRKYRGMEDVMNGGRMLDKEKGLRPFYQMLERGECLVILADIPAEAGGVTASPQFLGCRRLLSGGALRMARKTGSDIGAFVCRCDKPGNYRVQGGPIVAARDPQSLDIVYSFLSEEIQATPGKWWASYLLPLMTPVDQSSPGGRTC